MSKTFIPNQIVEGDEILVPTFEVVSCPKIKISDLKKINPNILDSLDRTLYEKNFGFWSREYVREYSND